MQTWVFAVDLGGTKTEVGLVSPENRIVGRTRFPTEDGLGPASIVARIAGAAEGLAVAHLPAGVAVAGLGICTPGPVDAEGGRLLDPPNVPGLHHAPMRELLAARLHLPVAVEHDAKASGLGELAFGAARGERSLAYIIAGTGVGAAFIMDGKVLRGVHNYAGEIGHSTLDLHGERCSCGNRGCVETFISGPWLGRRYVAARDGLAAIPAASELGGEQVAKLAAAGDAVARQVIADAGEALGAAVGTLAMVLDIECFVIGGSVAKCGEMLLEPARQAVSRHAFRSVASHVRILQNQLDTDGALLGCAWLARQAGSAAG